MKNIAQRILVTDHEIFTKTYNMKVHPYDGERNITEHIYMLETKCGTPCFSYAWYGNDNWFENNRKDNLSSSKFHSFKSI